MSAKSKRIFSSNLKHYLFCPSLTDSKPISNVTESTFSAPLEVRIQYNRAIASIFSSCCIPNGVSVGNRISSN